MGRVWSSDGDVWSTTSDRDSTQQDFISQKEHRDTLMWDLGAAEMGLAGFRLPGA